MIYFRGIVLVLGIDLIAANIEDSLWLACLGAALVGFYVGMAENA